MTFELARPVKIRGESLGDFITWVTSRVERTFFTRLSRKCDANPEIVQHRARLVDASVRAGLARQLRLRSREVSSLYFFYRSLSPWRHSRDKISQALSPNFNVLQVQRSYAGLLHAHEYTQGERAWERGYVWGMTYVHCIHIKWYLHLSSYNWYSHHRLAS